MRKLILSLVVMALCSLPAQAAVIKSGLRSPAPPKVSTMPVVSNPTTPKPVVAKMPEKPFTVKEGIAVGRAIEGSTEFLYLNFGSTSPFKSSQIKLWVNGRLVTLERMSSSTGNAIYRIKLSEVPNTAGQVKQMKVPYIGDPMVSKKTPITRYRTVTDYGQTGNPAEIQIRIPGQLEQGKLPGDIVRKPATPPDLTIRWDSKEIPAMKDSRRIDAPIYVLTNGSPNNYLSRPALMPVKK